MTNSTSTDNLSILQSTDTSLGLNWRDYYNLCKPKVVLLLLITALVGMYLATHESIPLSLVFWSMVGMGLAMSGAAAINHIVDYKIDSVMNRTKNRPIAKGRISTISALTFAFTLCVLSVLILDTYVNRLTTLLTMGGFVGYAIIYTLFLKRATPQNIVIGGLAGAIPPLLGWTAVSGELHPHAFLLVLIIYVWTPPHFWALAIHRKEEYSKAGIPMLPVTHGTEYTKTQVLLYTLLLIIASWLPFLTGMSGWLYMLCATLLGSIFLFYSIKLKWFCENGTAMKTFAYSIAYLFLLFIGLLADHWLQTIPK